MAKVTLRGYILVPKNDLEAVKAELADHKRLTLEESGCITFNVDQCEDDPCRFSVFEEFTDKKAFILHQERVQSSYWGKVTVNVQRFYGVSE